MNQLIEKALQDAEVRANLSSDCYELDSSPDTVPWN